MLLSSTLSLGCCPVSVSSGGGLHDCVQSSSRAEQVHQSRSLMTTDTSEHLLWPFFLSLQSWCHGLFLWLHLGHHHPRVPHSYPFIIDLWGYVDVQLSCKCLIYLHVFLGSCFSLKWSSVFFFDALPWLWSDIHHKRGETEKRQIAVSSVFQLREPLVLPRSNFWLAFTL